MSATIYHQLQTIFSYKLYTISYIQIAVFKTWNDIPWKASQLILDSQFMEVSSPVKHHHQQGSRRSSHGEPRDVLQQSAVIQFQKSGTNRSQTEQSSHWVSCKRCCSQRERTHLCGNNLRSRWFSILSSLKLAWSIVFPLRENILVLKTILKSSQIPVKLKAP